MIYARPLDDVLHLLERTDNFLHILNIIRNNNQIAVETRNRTSPPLVLDTHMWRPLLCAPAASKFPHSNT